MLLSGFIRLIRKQGRPVATGWAFLSVAFFYSCIMERLPFKRKKGKGQLPALTLPMIKPSGNAVFCDAPISLTRDRFSNLYVILSDAIPPDI